VSHTQASSRPSDPSSGTTTHDGPKSGPAGESGPARHPESDVLDRISALVDDQMHGGEDVAHWRAANRYPLDADGNCACPVCTGEPYRPDFGIGYIGPELVQHAIQSMAVALAGIWDFERNEGESDEDYAARFLASIAELGLT
jgi:hypothetical protein